MSVDRVVVIEEAGIGNVFVLGDITSGSLIMCVVCERHVDDGVMTVQCPLSVDAILKIKGGRVGVWCWGRGLGGDGKVL